MLIKDLTLNKALEEVEKGNSDISEVGTFEVKAVRIYNDFSNTIYHDIVLGDHPRIQLYVRGAYCPIIEGDKIRVFSVKENTFNYYSTVPKDAYFDVRTGSRINVIKSYEEKI